MDLRQWIPDRLTLWQRLAIAAGVVVVTLLLLYLIKDTLGRPLVFHARTLTSTLTGVLIGALLGGVVLMLRAIFSIQSKWLMGGIVLVLVIIGDLLMPQSMISQFTSGVGGFLGFVVGLALILSQVVTVRPPTSIPNVFGSSRWATNVDLALWGLIGKPNDSSGLFLGEDEKTGLPIVYDGDMHALTVAPTRTGKGASAIIPNLLRSNSSILVIDPKGENARRTAAKRIEMGQKVYVVDPWGISAQADQFGEGIDPELLCGFDPLAFLDPHDPDLVSDAMLLAESLIVPSSQEPFWTDEAKALVHGFILYVITEDEEAENRTLARVRDIMSLPMAMPDETNKVGTLDEIIIKMSVSDHLVVRQAAARLAQKAEKEFAGVMSSAQSNTHFLDSPKIRDSLSESSFRFADLKTAPEGVTVYLVLPLDRLQTFHRWLRLIITAALIDLTRTPIQPGKPPVRAILDEFAALGNLKLIETAYGTMAGLGVQLWVLTQDLSQLMKLYGEKSWQTFVSNAGVLQYFGSRDYETAKYAEHLCGMTTMKKRSFSFGKTSGYSSGGSGGGSSSSGSSETTSHDDVSRPLAYADEMMTLRRDLQVLFVENRYPIIAKKRYWFDALEKSDGTATGTQMETVFNPSDTQPIGVSDDS